MNIYNVTKEKLGGAGTNNQNIKIPLKHKEGGFAIFNRTRRD